MKWVQILDQGSRAALCDEKTRELDHTPDKNYKKNVKDHVRFVRLCDRQPNCLLIVERKCCMFGRSTFQNWSGTKCRC